MLGRARFGTGTLLLVAGALHCGRVDDGPNNTPIDAPDADVRQTDAGQADASSVDAQSEVEDSPAPIDFGPTAAQHAAAWCERFAACEPGTYLFDYGDSERCMRIIARQWQLHSGLPGITMTPDSLEACAQALGTLDCLDWRQEILPEPCRPQGQLPNQAPCVSSWQCAAGGFCSGSPRSCIGGVCPVAPACGGTCYGESNRTCRIGDRCSSDEAVCCVRGLTCSAGGCQLPPGEGQPCAFGNTCDSSQLQTCVDGTCRPMTVASPGEPCDVNRPCPGGYYCVGVCKPFVPEGGACPGAEVCEFPARCTGGLCRIADPPKCPN